MLDPIQLLALVVIAIAAGIYASRSSKRVRRADAAFFATLVERVTQALQPKGFKLKDQIYLPQSFGHRIATFEGPAFLVDVTWDGREGDLALFRRDPHTRHAGNGEKVAAVHVFRGARPNVQAAALGTILSAVQRIDPQEPLPTPPPQPIVPPAPAVSLTLGAPRRSRRPPFGLVLLGAAGIIVGMIVLIELALSRWAPWAAGWTVSVIVTWVWIYHMLPVVKKQRPMVPGTVRAVAWAVGIAAILVGGLYALPL